MAQRKLKLETPGQAFQRRVKADRAFRMVFNRLFDQENRIRVLEGDQPLTRPQYRALLKTDFEA